MNKPRAVALGCFLAVVGASAAHAQSNTSSASSTGPAANTIKVPAGQTLVLELGNSLHTRSNRKGDVARFDTMQDIFAGPRVAIPRGSTVRATLTKVKRPGRLKGRAEIRLRFDEIELPDGTVLPFQAQILRAGFRDVDNGKQGIAVKGEGNKGRDALQVAVQGGQGALLGAAIGGKKGAAYGGAIGAGIGLLGVLLRRGPELALPPGTLFEVELEQALAVPAASAVQRARGGPPAASSASSSPGGFRFPEESPRASTEPEIPDFGDEDTPEETAQEEGSTEEPTEVAVNRPPSTTQPPSPAGPPPPVMDPTLGDPDAYRLRVNVRLVMVEAFVRDRRGRPMDDLKKEDFRLFEDGVEQKVRHFSRDELPLAVALVVDRSGSVAPFMSELRRAAYETLSRLKREDQVALFSFASSVRRLEGLTTDRRRIAERISRIRAGGGTNIVDAVFEALYYLRVAAPDRRRAVILISDNEATQPGNVDQDDLIRMALEAGVVVYSIKTPGVSTRGSLLGLPMPSITFGTGSVKKITRDTGGEIIDVERTGSLTAALDAVVSRLKTRYTLGYHPSNKTRDGSFRRIDVRLVPRYGSPADDYTVHARKGYYAPDETVASQPSPADNR